MSLSLPCPVQPPVPTDCELWEHRACCCRNWGCGGDRDSLIPAVCSATIPEATAGLEGDEELPEGLHGAALQLTSPLEQHPRIYQPASFLSRIPAAKGSACFCPPCCPSLCPEKGHSLLSLWCCCGALIFDFCSIQPH